MADHTDRLLARLWTAFGSRETPSEWDGNSHGGGRLSQRFWEYHWALRQARLAPDSVVLDVGAGSTAFLPLLLVGEVAQVFACDPELPGDLPSAVTALREPLSASLLARAPFTHLLSVSVIEHLAPDQLEEHLSLLGSVPARVVVTLEFGERPHGSNLTLQELYRVGAAFPRHYCRTFELCPVFADNSYPGPHPLWRPLGLVFDPLPEARS